MLVYSFEDGDGADNEDDEDVYRSANKFVGWILEKFVRYCFLWVSC